MDKRSYINDVYSSIGSHRFSSALFTIFAALLFYGRYVLFMSDWLGSNRFILPSSENSNNNNPRRRLKLSILWRAYPFESSVKVSLLFIIVPPLTQHLYTIQWLTWHWTTIIINFSASRDHSLKGVIQTHLNSWWPVKGQLKWLAQDPQCLYPLRTTQVTLMLCSMSSSGWMDEDCASYCVLCHSLLLVVLVVIILMLSAYSENFRNETDSHHPLKDSRGNS